MVLCSRGCRSHMWFKIIGKESDFYVQFELESKRSFEAKLSYFSYHDINP